MKINIPEKNLHKKNKSSSTSKNSENTPNSIGNFF